MLIIFPEQAGYKMLRDFLCFILFASRISQKDVDRFSK